MSGEPGPKPWFRPKYTGYGYTPANAKGWVALLLFVLVIVATMALLGEPTTRKSPEIAAQVAHLRSVLGLSGLNLPLLARFALVGVEVVIFFAFAQSKSRLPAGPD
jgi:hypothetical protein